MMCERRRVEKVGDQGRKKECVSYRVCISLLAPSGIRPGANPPHTRLADVRAVHIWDYCLPRIHAAQQDSEESVAWRDVY